MNDRARVPFALVGVLLLVSSATVAVTRPAERRSTEPAVERSVEAVRADLATALRHSARRAGRDAARNPVVAPANTTAGRLLDEPYRDALRLRVHERFRRALQRLEEREGNAVAVARLPATTDAESLRRALERTTVTRAGPNGTALRVAVEGVTLAVRRGGRPVERLRVSPSVVVASPTLFVHDRVSAFQRRLNASATEPGLGRRLTARLYPVAWTRGGAQYGGAPIENVVGTRHVALATNDALLAAQRRAFGREDPDAASRLRAAAVRAGAHDLAAGAGVPKPLVPTVADAAGDAVPERDAHRPEELTSVSVGRSADAAFLSMLDGGVANATRSAYGVRVRLATVVRDRETEVSGDPRPGAEWSVVDTRREAAVRTADESVEGPAASDGWHRLWRAGRRVVREETVVRRWEAGNRTRTTTTVRRTTADVGLAVLGDHERGTLAPARPVDGVHRRGGPLSGPNLADVGSHAVDRLVERRGGADELAARAVAGGLDASPVRVVGERPPELGRWVARDLIDLRERVRNVSVSVSRGRLGTYRADPAAELASALRERRATLVDAPARYASAAGKARVAARAAYLDRVLARLERRSDRHRAAGDRFASVLAEHGVSPSELSAIERNRSRAAVPDRGDFRGLGGELRLRVDAAPAYLSVRGVPPGEVPADVAGPFRGLATRNRNLFTLPYEDAADAVLGELLGGRRVRLRTAARALQAVDRLPDDAVDGSVASRRRALRLSLADALGRVERRYRRVLRRNGVGDGPRERRAIVRAGLSEWASPAARALAVANGSAAGAVRAAATRRSARRDDLTADRLRLALRAAGREVAAERAVTVPLGPVRRATAAVRALAPVVDEYVVKRGAGAAADRAAAAAVSRAERRLGRSLARVPAGLPVTPVPAYWYATTNVWTVDAQGRYARFTVRADRGAPGAALAYSRDGSGVRFDWDGDGADELLGRASRVRFATGTVVAVAVPPGGQGVGDVDGNADERSPGFTASNRTSWLTTSSAALRSRRFFARTR